MSFLRPARRRLLAGLITMSALLFAVAPGTSHAADLGIPDQSYATLMGNVSTVLDTTVRAYMNRDSVSDTRYYADGLWISDVTICPACNMGPAVGAAVLSRDQPALLPVVTASVDRAIRDHQRANGAFYGDGNSDGIQTAWYAALIGEIYLTTEDRLDADTKVRWANSITAAADSLLNARETVWYVNGNINLSYTQVLWAAWKVSGAERFRTTYEASWQFTLNPPQPRWAGYGLFLTTTPTRADGADGAGYLAESAGFDPEYAQLQLDILSGFYAVSREPRALWLMNILMNGLLPRVDSTFTLDARNGSRRSLMTPFMTPALSVLVGSGSRPDLASKLAGQLRRVFSEYAGAITYTHPSFYRGVGTWLAAPLIAADVAVSPPTVVAAPAPQITSPSVQAPATSSSAQLSPTVVVTRAPSLRPKTTSATNTTAETATTAPRVSARSGALQVTVSAPTGATVSTTLRCGTAKCGSAADVRAAGGRMTIRLRMTRGLLQRIRRSGAQQAVVVVTIRSGSGSQVLRRSVRLAR